MSLTKRQIQLRQLTVRDSINQGEEIKKIASNLNVSSGTVYLDAKELKKQGLISADWKKRLKRKTERRLFLEAAINQGLADGVCQSAIAGSLEICREYVRQIVNEMVAESKLSAEYLATISSADAAEKLGLERQHVLTACKRGLVLCYYMYGNNYIQYRILRSELPILQVAVELVKEKFCPICRQYFVPQSGHGRDNLCSDRCRKDSKKSTSKRNYLKRRYSRLVNPDTRMAKIQRQLPGPSGEWLTRKFACDKYAVTEMQLTYLVDCGVLSTIDHPTRTWRGKPVRMMAESQLDFVAKVYSGEISLDDVPIVG